MKYKLLLLVFAFIAIVLHGMEEGDWNKAPIARKDVSSVQEYLATMNDFLYDEEPLSGVIELQNGITITRRPIVGQNSTSEIDNKDEGGQKNSSLALSTMKVLLPRVLFLQMNSTDTEVFNLWDLDSNTQKLLHFPEIIGSAWCLSRDKKIIFFCKDKRTVYSYDIATLQLLGEFKLPCAICSMSALWENNLCCAMVNGEAIACDQSGKESFSFKAHKGIFTCISLGVDALITADSSTIKCWRKAVDNQWKNTCNYAFSPFNIFALSTKQLEDLVTSLSGKRLLVLLKETKIFSDAVKWSFVLLNSSTLKPVKEYILSSPFNVRASNGETFYLVQIGCTREKSNRIYKKIMLLNAKTGKIAVKKLIASEKYDIESLPWFEISPDEQFMILYNAKEGIVKIELHSIKKKHAKEFLEEEILVLN